MAKNTEPSTENMRLDKWLWCARFFKTRSQATDAIKTGKIIVNKTRVKPAKTIQPDDIINIRRGPYHFEITVLKLAKSRQAATAASQLYEETQASIEEREQLASQLKTERALYPRTKGRPSKRNRRQLIRFKSGTRN